MGKKMVTALIAVVLVSMLTVTALAASVYFTGNSNVRTGPGLDYSSKGSVNRGSYLTFLNDTSYDNRGVAWYKVSFGSGSGWVSSKYSYITDNGGFASYGAGGTGGSGYSGGYMGEYDDYDGGLYSRDVHAVYGDTTVRSGPGLNYSKVGTMVKGDGAVYMDHYAIDNRGVKWYYIHWCGMDAWVSSRYTEIW